MNKKRHHIRGTTITNYEDARRNRCGPYEEYSEALGGREFDNRFINTDTGITSELDAAENELHQFCNERGQPVEIADNGNECTRAQHDTPERERVNMAIDILCSIARIRHALAAGALNQDRLADVFRLGQNLERWRMMPFSDPAATRIKQEEQKRAGTSDYWEPIMQRAAQAEIHSLNTGEIARTARGHALDAITHETGTDRTKASARYKKWRKANPGVLPEKALH